MCFEYLRTSQIHGCCNKRRRNELYEKKARRAGALLTAAVLALGTLTVHAEELPASWEALSVEAADNADLSGDSLSESEKNAELAQMEETSELTVDDQGEVLDVSDRLNQRSVSLLSDNPRAVISGELTADNTMDLHFFTVTSDKFMIAYLQSNNKNYAVQLYIIDYDAGTATPTAISGMADHITGLNGLPTGDYALAVFSTDGTAGDSYTLSVNSANPSGTLTDREFYEGFRMMATYSNGDVYFDGSFFYNPKDMNQDQANSQMDWHRELTTNWSGGYRHRDHDVYNVHIQKVEGPYSYSAQYAQSDAVMFVYCDIGTCFAYMESFYESGSTHKISRIDTLGKLTPRVLEADDFDDLDLEHVLIYDLNTGKSIDFYSPLNYYYIMGAEGKPAYEAIRLFSF